MERELTQSVVDKRPIQGEVFRIIASENGLCKKSLPVRFETTEFGWAASFYGPHALRDAETRFNPLTEIHADVADLVIEAMKLLKDRQAKWLSELE